MAIQIMKNEKLNCELQYIVVDGIPWFRGLYVAKVLGYENPAHSIERHVRNKHKTQRRNLCLKRTSLKFAKMLGLFQNLASIL